ncbi:MAG: sugar phosphate isomerase/epimerase family protein [Planctomycetota bacterium]
MRSRQLRQSSICQFSTSTWKLTEDIVRYKNYGIESIGVWRRKLEACGLEQAVDLLFDSKLNVSSLHWSGGFTGADSTRDEAIEDTYDAIRLAARINAGTLLVHPGASNGHIFNHIHRVVRDSYEQTLTFAEDYGVSISIEPILDHPYSPWTIYQSLDQYLELLDEFPNLGICLDLYHVGLFDEAFDRLAEYADRIKLVQLADRTMESLTRSQAFTNRRYQYRLPLGQGDIAIESWLERLQSFGYRGPYEVEIHGIGGPRESHFRTLDDASAFFANQFSVAKPGSKIRLDA